MEGDLDKLADIAFNDPIKTKGSIQIQGDFENIIDLFEALLMLFTKGMRKLFAIDGQVNLSELTETQFSDFTTRFQSLGITPIVAKYHIYQLFKLQNVTIEENIEKEWLETQQNYPVDISLDTLSNYTTTNSDNLKDYYFQFQSENNYYIINFNIL